jgi:tRNA-dihydrouridine synthase
MKSLKEVEYLTSEVAQRGYTRIDLNMGCPFPMQARHGRGAGLLAQTDIIRTIAQAIETRPNLRFSVKMRLGWEDKDEWRPVLEVLNTLPLTHITLHPRIGTQQYKGEVDMESFRAFYEACRHPLVYNGDIHTLDDIRSLEEAYPRLAGVMIGRGLLARPSLAIEYATEQEWSPEKQRKLLTDIHQALMEHWQPLMNSDAQLMNKLRTFWEYAEEVVGRKVYKKLMKSGSLKNYLGAVSEVKR